MATRCWLLLAATLCICIAYSASIPGPSSPNARIGIVGGGPAGLHMSYLLQQLGFKHVVLLEADSQVGGRSVSLDDGEGLVHEMAACYVTSDYDDVKRLASWAGVDLQLRTLPTATLTGANGTTQAMLQFLLQRARQLLQLDDSVGDNEVMQEIGEAGVRYSQLWQQIFPAGQFEFPLRRVAVNGSVAEFLQHHRLLALEPLFILGMTTMGYGSLTDTSAVYGLMWMTPKYLDDLLADREKSQLAMLGRGFQRLWPQVRTKLHADIRLDARVSSVRRTHGRVAVSLEDGRREYFDWLVWTPNLAATAGLFKDLDDAEQEIFSSISSRYFRTQLLEFPAGPPMTDVVTYFAENLLTERPLPGRLWAMRNSAKALGSEHGQNSLVAYYLSNERLPGSKVRLPGSKVRLPGSNVRADFQFHFMPRFSIQRMNSGVLWDILEHLQGRRSVWFAGHSVVFDSVKSVMKYNKMLLSLALPEAAALIRQL